MERQRKITLKKLSPVSIKKKRSSLQISSMATLINCQWSLFLVSISQAMPNHSSRSSEKSSLFRRSKTLPTGSYRRFTTPLIPTYRYYSASDLRRDGDGGSCDSDTTNSAVAVLNSESAPSQVLATQSPSQRITKLWTHFSLTLCVCYFFFYVQAKPA